MKKICLIFKWLRRSDWASPPDPSRRRRADETWRPFWATDANTGSSQRRAPLGKGATLSGATQTADVSRYWRQHGAVIEYGP